MRILSGIQPSGKLHIGNYFSMMRKMIHYQENEELLCFIANLHALTTFKSAEEMKNDTYYAALDFLALGLDPEKSIFWVQSDVPEVCELTWYLSTVFTVSGLSKAHSYKDKVAKGIVPSQALFSYPILMAADILAYGTEKVPVGQDQKQHLEIARDIAIAFNSKYGDVFIVPDAEIDENVKKIPGVDGEKMSKSTGNTINFFDTEAKIKKSVFSIKTDSAGFEEPKNPDNSILFHIYSFDSEKKLLSDKFKSGGVGYGQIKKELLETILKYYEPYRAKRAELEKNPDIIWDTLSDGARKARNIAKPIMEAVRQKAGVIYKI
jgi:tryptophanyl-tRNA synthetase